MADWRNRLEQIVNKFKFQLNAKGVDNIDQLRDVFNVSYTSYYSKTFENKLNNFV